jgi:hypothetical protein
MRSIGLERRYLASSNDERPRFLRTGSFLARH